MSLRRIFVLVLREPACICGPGSGSSIVDVRAVGPRCTGTPPESGSCFVTAPTPFVVRSQPVMRSLRNNVLAICLIFEAARPPPGAPGGSSWVGGIEGVDTCGVSPKLFASFFGAAGDAGRFFLGFRPRLLGMTMREVWHG